MPLIPRSTDEAQSSAAAGEPPPKPTPQEVPPPPPVSVPPPPPASSRITAALPGSAPNWFYVRRRGEFPGNHPPYDTLRQIGITGILTEADDPLLVEGLQMDRAAGWQVGVWIDPGRAPTTPDTVAQLRAALGKTDPGTIVIDLEGAVKGPGTDIFTGSAALANALADFFPGSTVEATSPPTWNDDYNLKAWALAGHDVQVQTYGADPQVDLLDPVATVKHLLDAGIPAARLSVLIAPKQLPTAPPALRALGITRISVFTQDGLTPEVVSAAAPFLPLYRYLHPAHSKRRLLHRRLLTMLRPNRHRRRRKV